jgi:hypothetical protein
VRALFLVREVRRQEPTSLVSPQHQKRVRQGCIFFSYGALVHALMLKIYLDHAYQRPATPGFASNPITYAILGIAGGISVAWFMLRLLEIALASQRAHPIRVLGRGGLYGIAATMVAVPSASLLASLLLGFRLSSRAWQGPLFSVLLMSEIGTYAMGLALFSAPYAFAYGSFGAAYVLLIRRYETALPESTDPLRNTGKLSLTLGVLSLALVFIPPVGLVLGGLAIFHGLRTRKQDYGQALARPTSAKVGAALGALCVLFWLFALGVYIAAGHGWLR